MKKLLRYIVLFFVAALVIIAPFVVAAAQQQEVRAAVTVGGVVPTTVTSTESVVNISTTAVLADETQKTVVNAILKDKDEKPVAGAIVFVYSNRGSIDKITPIDAAGNSISKAPWGVSVAYAATQTIDGNTGTAVPTDANGQAHFKITSDVPGIATITVVADGLVRLAEFKVNFIPLPFPKYLSIGFEVPKFFNKTGQITIFKPAAPALGTQQTDGGIVNLGAQLVIPLWAMILIAFLVVLTPLLIYHVLASLRRVRKNQKQEKDLISLETDEIHRESVLLEQTKKELESLKDSHV